MNDTMAMKRIQGHDLSIAIRGINIASILKYKNSESLKCHSKCIVLIEVTEISISTRLGHSLIYNAYFP